MSSVRDAAIIEGRSVCGFDGKLCVLAMVFKTYGCNGSVCTVICNLELRCRHVTGRVRNYIACAGLKVRKKSVRVRHIRKPFGADRSLFEDSIAYWEDGCVTFCFSSARVR